MTDENKPPGEQIEGVEVHTSDKTKTRHASAGRSTGPRTAEGKHRSSRNSLRHGIFASSVLISGESAARFESLRRALTADLAPEGAGATEHILVEKLAVILWRHARFFRAETEEISKSMELGERFELEARNGSGPVKLDELGNQHGNITRTIPHQRMLVPLADIVERLMSYERHLGREIDRILNQLERLRRMRLKESTPFNSPPSAHTDRPTNGKSKNRKN